MSMEVSSVMHEVVRRVSNNSCMNKLYKLVLLVINYLC